ncbi:thiamine pyrophosphokinase [Myriangium duriaei CBS 260.36]|uniref:Thiamine pyrophosphokinase n=1 Tax=Myriangium duriaei CBS 260.36 TaxID=1168546 RepID=A0A9P4J9A4_9PEZI|nr:thiamine pyrophosphokinase [Myriangium duriaei CBS 260.36]
MEFFPLSFLDFKSPSSSSTTALMILNTPITSPDLLNRLWGNSSLHICADGGANRLFDLYQGWDTPMRGSCIPEEITGDLDSLRPDVKAFYTKHRTAIVHDTDQYSTDFEKALSRVTASMVGVKDVLVLGSLSGRVDHGLGLLSGFYREVKRRPEMRLWLFSEASVSFVLPVGESRVKVERSTGLVTENVGVLPVFGPARITLEGFEWDVQDWETEMGGKVSTSNHAKEDVVVVKTDKAVLFTIERRA